MLLYLHIPYCDSKCHYCSFNSYTDKFDTRPLYMRALTSQIRFELERFGAGAGSLETLFIGGGTPSTVMPALYEPIFQLLRHYLKEDAEITIEANPNSATKEWLQGMKRLGANRVSFGVQSFDAAKLKSLGRAHSPTQAISAIENAQTLGFEHISLDLIYNFRGDTQALLQKDIDMAFSLPIDHISAYELTIEADTPFAKSPTVRQEDEILARYVAESIISRGFVHYEISNFGSYQSRHNQGYWRLENYIGAGAGAVGFLNDTRYYPQTGIDAYIADPLVITEEKLTPEERLTERLFLGLRSQIGIAKSLLSSPMAQRADLLVSKGKLRFSKESYFNTDLFLADEIALYLLD